MEAEHKVSEEEHEEGHATQNDYFVPPTHVTAYCAASSSGGESVRTAGREIGVATVLRGSSECNGGCDNHTNGLPHGQQGDEVSTGLRQELEGDCRVDGDVTTKTDGRQEVNTADSAVVVLRCGLSSVLGLCQHLGWSSRRGLDRNRLHAGMLEITHQEHTKHRTYQTCQIESPFTSNDIDQKTETERSNGQTGVGATPDQTGFVVRDAHLLAAG